MRQKERLKSKFQFRLRKTSSWQTLKLPKVPRYLSFARFSRINSKSQRRRTQQMVRKLRETDLESTPNFYKDTASALLNDKSAERTRIASTFTSKIHQSQLWSMSRVYNLPTLLDFFVQIFRLRLQHLSSSTSRLTSIPTRRC